MRRGVWLVFTTVLLLFLGASVLVAAEVVALRSATDKVRNTYDPALLTTQTLLTGYVNQESGERGYLITGQPSFLAPYTQGQTTIMHAQVRLTTLIHGDPMLTSLLGATTVAATAWYAALTPELDARQSGNAALATQLVDGGASKTAFDTLRGKLADLQTAVQLRRSRAEHAQSRDAETLLVALIIAAATAMLAVVVLLIATRRWVLAPIAGLGTALARVQTGSLDSPITVDGPVEFQALAGDADAMRSRLIEEIDAASRATEGLAQRAPVVLDIQAALHDSARPEPGLDLFGVVATAEGEIAGDWWDLVTLGPGRQVLILADVSGHGASAGLLATQLKSVILTALALGASAPDVFRTAAQEVFEPQGEKFATAVLVSLDIGAGRISWANAGHPPPLLIRVDGETRTLGATGPIVHPIAAGWTVKSADFGPGDRLVAYSDGLTEARDASGAEFGVEGLLAGIDPGTDAEQTVMAVLAHLAQHSESRRQVDDVTLVVARRLLSPS